MTNNGPRRRSHVSNAKRRWCGRLIGGTLRTRRLRIEEQDLGADANNMGNLCQGPERDILLTALDGTDVRRHRPRGGGDISLAQPSGYTSGAKVSPNLFLQRIALSRSGSRLRFGASRVCLPLCQLPCPLTIRC